jgi:hypothetical protein
MKTKIWTGQILDQTKRLARTGNDDLAAVVAAAEDAVDEQMAVAMLPRLPKLHPK